jgi:hypothetical protein
LTECIIRNGSESVSLPIAPGMAGARADQQNVVQVAKLFFHPPHGAGCYWQVPTWLINLDSQRPWKLKESLDLVLEGDLRNLLTDENMVKVPGAGPVPAQANRGADQFAEQVGPGRYLHVQQYIEAAVTQFPAQFIHSAPATALVEFDEFDMIKAVE